MRDEHDNNTQDFIEVVSNNDQAKSERERIYNTGQVPAFPEHFNQLLKDNEDGFAEGNDE